MSISEWLLLGAMTALVIRALLSIPYMAAYKEHEDEYDRALDEAQGVVNSMKGELDYMRRDGLL